MKKYLILMVFLVIFLTSCDAVDELVIKVEPLPDTESTETIVEDTNDILEETVNPSVNDDVLTEDSNINTDEIVPDAPVKAFEISDMELKGRDVLTYGSFDEEFIKSLETTLDNYGPNISLAIYALDGSRGLVYNGNSEYFSACTVKMPWMLYLCKEIDAGRIDTSTVLTYEEKYYHSGSGSIRHGSYGDTYTVGELVNLSLSISDNVAYKMLVSDVIDRDGFNEYISTLNLDRFTVPSWSIWCSNAIATDFLTIWQEVYNYFETETEGAKLLKESCTNTKFNYGTLTLEGYDYSHKSGDNWDPNPAYNDAGIVYADIPYVYAVFTKSEGGKNSTKWTVNTVMSKVHDEFCGIN